MFDTYGTYTYTPCNATGIHALWEEFRADPTPNVENGVGVYVVAVEGHDGRLMPWYVGQTYKGFGARFKQHFASTRFDRIAEEGPLKILLIARAKRGRILLPQSGRAEKLDRKVIDWLEVDLIDKCRLINPRLLNRQFVKFLDGIWVGGYRGIQAFDRVDPAYSFLAKLLKLI